MRAPLRSGFVLLAIGLTWWGACAPPSETGRLLLHGVTLIDGTGGEPRPASTIVIRGGHIEAVRPSDTVTPAPGDSVIDGSGLWALPGLVDAHVHLSKTGAEALPVLVGMGVTTVRDMGGSLKELRTWESSIARDSIIGPRIFMAGPMLEAPATLERIRASETREPYGITRIAIPDTNRASEVVDSLAALDVDFVKIREYEDEATYRAIVEAAHDQGLPVAGHAPFSMDPVEAAALGVRSFEHASYPYPLDTLPAERREILDAFVRNSITIVPTLIAWETNVMDPDSVATLVADTGGARDPRMSVIPDRLRTEWEADLADFEPRASGYYAGYWGFLETMSGDLRAMYEAGVPLVAGSDLSGVALFPGFSLHEELERLVEWVGLTRMEAIVAATSEAARLLSASDSLGTIEPEKVADIVLLTADPTDDIRNTRRVHSVVLRGRFLGPARTGELRKGVPSTATGTTGLVRRR